MIAEASWGVRRSRAPAVRAMARPIAARTAPTRAGEVQPQPAEMARPPSQAPPAFARLKAEWLEAEAKVGACRALFITSICSGVVVRKPTAPSTTIAIGAASLERAAKWKATRTTDNVPSEM